MINMMNGLDRVTVSIRQNDTSVFLIGDIYDLITKSHIYDTEVKSIITSAPGLESKRIVKIFDGPI
jgi:hypothetical protein